MNNLDVIVIGGGPAGSTAATLIAKAGRSVTVLEREQFPRFRIGESLMPATHWSLKRLGVLEKMPGLAAPRKHSVQFFLKDGRGTDPFYFCDVQKDDSAVTWQVDRAAFDRMLLDHAAESGAEVHQGVAVREVLFEDDRAVGVSATFEDGDTRDLRASIIVDASGQSALLSHRLKLKEVDPRLRNASVFTRYRGAKRDPGRDAGATIIFHTANEDSWFWYIPLPDDVTSVGVVGSMDYLLRGRQGGAEQVFAEELALCPALRQRLAGAERLGKIQALKDFSYISRRIAGDGWILAGDAFGFLDPIYSSGVFLAMKGAEFAADSVLEALQEGDLSGARLGRRGPEFIAGMEALRRLVYAFYDPKFSFARFLKKYPQHREDLVHLLIGNVYRRPCDRLLEDLNATLDLPDYRPLRLAEVR